MIKHKKRHAGGTCGVGVNSLSIDPHGGLYLCESSDMHK